jgi:hypothetical protein
VLGHAGSPDESLSLVMIFAALWIGWAGWSRLKGRGFPRLPLVGAYALVGAGVALGVAAAVVPRAILSPGGVGASAVPGGPRPSSTASISFGRPTPNQTVTGPTLDVVVRLAGGTIVAGSSTSLAPDTGHIHLSLDGRLVSMTFGVVQQVDLQGLSPGPHTLVAEFVAADHAPFDPRVTARVRFRIGPGPS